MGREAAGARPKLRRGLWSPEEDEKLYNHIIRCGVGCWSSVPKLAGLERCGKSCRLRWINYLRPDLKRGSFSQQEEDLIISLHKILGNRWSQIASQLPGRTDNEIKNYWNTHIKRKLLARGIDPQTHRPVNATTAPAQQQQHYQPPASFAASPPAGQHHQQLRQDYFAGVMSYSTEACSHSSDDEQRSTTPPPTTTRPRHLDIDLNLSISLAPYQPPEESGDNKPLKQLPTPMTMAAVNNINAVPVCLCLNSLGYRPGVECVCGGSSSRQQQEHWARGSILQAAPCYRGQ